MPAEREKCQKQKSIERAISRPFADVVLEMRATPKFFLARWRILPCRDSRMKIPSGCVFISHTRVRKCCAHAACEWKKNPLEKWSQGCARRTSCNQHEFEWWRLARTSWRSNAQINQLNKLRLVRSRSLDKSYPLILRRAKVEANKAAAPANDGWRWERG